MRTSKQWWDETKADPEKLNAWLTKQYVGEFEASKRINELKYQFWGVLNEGQVNIITKIADDELRHSMWIGSLLRNRGLPVDSGEATMRYWKHTMAEDFESLEQACAIGAHAEQMRLQRIQVISNDKTAPWDIREVFRKIELDEIGHADFFRSMTTDKDFADALANHEAGMAALGLVV